jgi:hypothetical protein
MISHSLPWLHWAQLGISQLSLYKTLYDDVTNWKL